MDNQNYGKKIENFVKEIEILTVLIFFCFLELLPRLVPRPYSAACTQSHQDKRIRFVYSIMTFPKGTGRCYKRCGLATDYLMSLNVGDYVEVTLFCKLSYLSLICLLLFFISSICCKQIFLNF